MGQGRGIAAVGAAATMEVTEPVASTAGGAITVVRPTAADMAAAIGAAITAAVLIAVAAASGAEQSMAEAGSTAVAGMADAGKFA